MIEAAKLPDRASVPLFDAALGFRLTNARYRADAEVTELVASRDLKRISDAGLLMAIGEKRGRVYRAGSALTAARVETRLPRPLENPYDVVEGRLRRAASNEMPRLPGL